MRALLIGKRARILDYVAAILRGQGWEVVTENNLDMSHLQAVNVSSVTVVAFGRALTTEQRAALVAVYRKQQPTLVTVEGWAPIPELVAHQIYAASSPIPGLRVQDGQITAQNRLDVHLKAFKLNWLYRLKTKEEDLVLDPSQSLDISAIMPGYQFASLEHSGGYSVIKLK